MQIDRASFTYVSLLALVLTGVGPATARAQSTIGYVVAGPAVVTGIGIRDSAWQVGGGGELVNGYYSIGGQVDYIYFPEVNKTSSYGGSSSPAASMAAFALNGSAYPRRDRSQRMQPFLAGGVTFFMDEGSLPSLHFGGGVDWWRTRNVGVRVEAVVQSLGMVAVRCGVVFR